MKGLAKLIGKRSVFLQTEEKVCWVSFSLCCLHVAASVFETVIPQMTPYLAKSERSKVTPPEIQKLGRCPMKETLGCLMGW